MPDQSSTIVSTTKYHCIGRGLCGSVWTNDSLTAVKREDGSPNRSITNDYTMHLRILSAFQTHPPVLPLLITQCHALVQADSSWWTPRLLNFPTGYQPCRALLTERIPPVPRSISNELVDLICGTNTPLSTFVKSNPDDDDCLIRAYLGRRSRHSQSTNTSRCQRFSLRNVPLHIDQMEELGLDTHAYARAMADALAVMYWVAGVDANDVEFVLAPRESSTSPTEIFESEFLGRHSMWVLVFDCVRVMSMDEKGVRAAVEAWWRNDPYFPRPGGEVEGNEVLWRVFRERFLKVSRRFVGDDEERRGLPEMMVGMIEEEGKRRRRRREQQVDVVE